MVFRDSPNSRAACRMLMPSTCTARLMRAYTSTLYTSRCPTKHNYPVMFLELKVWWSTFRPPQTAAYAAFCGLLLLRRLYRAFVEGLCRPRFPAVRTVNLRGEAEDPRILRK